MIAQNIPLTFLDRNPETGEFDLLKHSPLEKGGDFLSREPAEYARDPEEGGRVVIVGGGVAGLTAAYDLMKQNRRRPRNKHYQVTVLEALGRCGGRSLTLRPGDSFTEEFVDKDGDHQRVTQSMTFEREQGSPYLPYLNAGPGRIPSHHTRVLALCQELEVDLEIYVMESRSNLVYTKTGLQGGLKENRQVANDIRGHIANELYHILKDSAVQGGEEATNTRKNYLQLLKYFGALDTAPNNGPVSYKGSQRAGFDKLPGLNDSGTLRVPIPKNDLINAELWKRSFYQAEDLLWQQTSFQPVGGMDMIIKKLEVKIREMAREFNWDYDPIRVNSPVSSMRGNSQGWLVQSTQNGRPRTDIGHFCLVNMPVILLKDKIKYEDFDASYRNDLKTVVESNGFFRPTCKVGWQAERKLWQVPKDINDVPIFGGVSRIDHPMTQMWYPSDDWFGKLGSLTGAYNYADEATRWGKMMPQDRIDEARKGAEKLHGPEFARQLRHGVSIAWQNIPTQLGGWTDWKFIHKDEKEQARIMNSVRKGNKNFHILGDQVSFIPGWKEGAIATAIEVFAKVTLVKGYSLPEIEKVPDTQALVEGYQY